MAIRQGWNDCAIELSEGPLEIIYGITEGRYSVLDVRSVVSAALQPVLSTLRRQMCCKTIQQGHTSEHVVHFQVFSRANQLVANVSGRCCRRRRSVLSATRPSLTEWALEEEEEPVRCGRRELGVDEQDDILSEIEECSRCSRLARAGAA